MDEDDDHGADDERREMLKQRREIAEAHEAEDDLMRDIARGLN